MKISVFGCGRWGTFIAWYLDKISHEIVLWGRENSSHLAQLKKERKNEYLTLSDTLVLTSDIQAAVIHSEVIVISISAQELRQFINVLKEFPVDHKTIVLCMKGIENTTGLRLSQVVEEALGNRVKIAVWVGPGHVQDFEAGIPNCMVIDSNDEKIKKDLVDSFSSDLIRFYYGSDLIGSEIGAAAKNVIGIAAGILDGLKLTSLKGALMARGTREVARLIKAMGGKEMTAYGLTHLGDYEATVFSAYSHNRKYGESLVTKEPYQFLAEGVDTSAALILLKDRYHTDLPICTAVYETIQYGKDPKKMIANLFLRSLKDEFS